MPSTSPSDDSPRISRTEYFWLAGAIVLGAVLRFSFPGRMAIEHFDEGVYASNFWFGAEDGYEYPARHLYAPPLLPAVIEWTMIIASLCGVRPTGFIPMIPCLIAGVITIPSMWWVGRRWFGPTAGIVSAWLVAGSDFHASYSRTALTDVPVCLFILWGVYFFWQALQSGTRRDVVLAALFTALAWWTKYNGWLPLAIGLAGGLAWQLFRTGAARQIFTFWKRWLVVAALAFAVWSPVLYGLQKHGGYSAVAANHRQYVVGIHGWGPAALEQLEHVGTYDNWWGLVFELMASGQHNDVTPVESLANQYPIVREGLTLMTAIVLGAIGMAGCVFWIVYQRRSAEGQGWFLTAWICGLSLATPFYHPYPRLVLPWLMAVWLAVGLAIQLVVASGRFGTTPVSSEWKWKPAWCEIALAAWLVVFTITRSMIGTERCWQDRSESARTTEALASKIKSMTADAGFPEDEAMAYVYGEPPIVFSLKASGLSLVGPVQSLDFMKGPHPRPTFLFRTTRVFSMPGFKDQWQAHEHSLEPVAQKKIWESHLVEYDDSRTSAVTQQGEEIQVFRVR